MEREPDHDALLAAIGDLLRTWAYPLFFKQVPVLSIYKDRGVSAVFIYAKDPPYSVLLLFYL